MRNSKPAEERRKEIIDVALQLFLEKGYEKTSIKDITEKMHIATGLFHYYFRSKEDVLIACAALNSQMITEELELETFFDGKKNAVEKINLLMSQVLYNVSEKSKIIKEKDSTKINASLLSDRIACNTLDIIIKKLVEFIKEGNEEGIFCCAYPQEAAEVFVYGFQRQFHKQKEREEALKEVTLSQYFIKNEKKFAQLFANMLCMKKEYCFDFGIESVCS